MKKSQNVGIKSTFTPTKIIIYEMAFFLLGLVKGYRCHCISYADRIQMSL